jgi:hypothetical protein
MDAHEREYAAAAEGMADLYGSATDLPAVGDFVNGKTAGRFWSGYVISAEPGRLAVECAGAWIVVHPRDMVRA